MSLIAVETIRTALCGTGMPREEVNAIKGRRNLLEEASRRGIDLQQLINLDRMTTTEHEPDVNEDDITSVMQATPKGVPTATTSEYVPRNAEKFSEEWNALVLSKFTEEELFPNPLNPNQKIPNINGLRRIGSASLPDLVFQGPVQISTNIVDARPWVSVLYRISYSEYPVGRYVDITQPYQVDIVAAGDCWTGNAPPNTGVAYATALAETRAESRAWKKILGLTVPTYEELSEKTNDVTTDGSVDMEDRASDISKSAIDNKCKILGIDTLKFINRKKYLEPDKYKDTPDISLDDLTKTLAKSMLSELNNYQNNSDLAKEIPPQILRD